MEPRCPEPYKDAGKKQQKTSELDEKQKWW
jgi:hypothetical protein